MTLRPRKVESSSQIIPGNGQPCPLCERPSRWLVRWKFWDAHTQVLLEEYFCCFACNNVKYKLAK